MGIGGRGAGEKRKNTAESGDAQGVKRQKPDDADGAAEDELDLEIEAADADANELDDAVAAADEDLALDDTLAHDTLPPEPSSRGRAHWTRPAAPPLPSEPSSFCTLTLLLSFHSHTFAFTTLSVSPGVCIEGLHLYLWIMLVPGVCLKLNKIGSLC